MTLIFDLIFQTIPHRTFMYNFIYYFSQIIGLLFVLLYFHQFIYLIIGSLKNAKVKEKDFKQHSIGVVVSARNESKVIGNLIKSIQANDYPKELLKIFVIADNCTDNTAQICRDLGCIVFERHDLTKIGKGYALNYLFTKLHTEEEYKDLLPDAYIIADADNILKPNFITEMNKVYDSGYEMITAYRNSKNFGDNWVSSGFGYWFLHESKHLNNSRMMCNLSCAISGTGFLISRPLVEEFDNWKFFTLTEDIECSTAYSLKGGKVGYCATAELYDEQPTSFKQSWRQRERWAKGFYQVFGKSGGKLLANSFKNFSCWDILTTLFPALVLSLATITVVPLCCIISLIIGDYVAAQYAVISLVIVIAQMYGLMFVIGLLLCITEWKKIMCSNGKKILYLFTFPVFMMTYLPIAIGAMFKRVEWKPIVHSSNKTLEDIEQNKTK